MTAKDVFLLPRHRYQSPVARSKLKFLNLFDKKAYLNVEILFGFSNSEFMNDNAFSLKDKKKRYRDFSQSACAFYGKLWDSVLIRCSSFLITF